MSLPCNLCLYSPALEPSIPSLDLSFSVKAWSPAKSQLEAKYRHARSPISQVFCPGDTLKDVSAVPSWQGLPEAQTCPWPPAP